MDQGPPSHYNVPYPSENSPGSSFVPLRQKRKKSVPREMSSKHKTLNSDSESSDEGEAPLNPVSFRSQSISHSIPVSKDYLHEHIPPHGMPPPPVGSIPPSVAPTTVLQSSYTTPQPPVAPIPPPVEAQEPVKRGRGRPRKYPKETEPKLPKRPRGRPRKSVSSENVPLKTLLDTFCSSASDLIDRLSSDATPSLVEEIRRSRNIVVLMSQRVNDDGELPHEQLELLEELARKNLMNP